MVWNTLSWAERLVEKHSVDLRIRITGADEMSMAKSSRFDVLSRNLVEDPAAGFARPDRKSRTNGGLL